jgi:hypothetical protein
VRALEDCRSSSERPMHLPRRFPAAPGKQERAWLVSARRVRGCGVDPLHRVDAGAVGDAGEAGYDRAGEGVVEARDSPVATTAAPIAAAVLRSSVLSGGMASSDLESGHDQWCEGSDVIPGCPLGEVATPLPGRRAPRG